MSTLAIVMAGSKDIIGSGGVPDGGTENYLKRTHRERLPVGYPDDLSMDSAPAAGSLGDKTMPIENRDPPFRLKGKR